MPKCVPTELYLVCPKNETLSLPASDPVIWKSLGNHPFNMDYITGHNRVALTKGSS